MVKNKIKRKDLCNIHELLDQPIKLVQEYMEIVDFLVFLAGGKTPNSQPYYRSL